MPVLQQAVERWEFREAIGGGILRESQGGGYLLPAINEQSSHSMMVQVSKEKGEMDG